MGNKTESREQLARRFEQLRRRVAELEQYESNRTLMLEELKASEEKFRALTENSPDVIMRFDREYRHLYANPAVEQYSGIPAEEFIGKTHEELGFDEELAAQWEYAIHRVFETGHEYHTEFTSGKKHSDWVLTPEFSPDGEVIAVLSSMRDLTEKKRVEEMIRKGESLEVARKLARTIAHEFRQPLASLRLIADITQMENFSMEILVDKAKRIPELVDRMDELVEKLLSIMNIESKQYAMNLEILDLDNSSGKKYQSKPIGTESDGQ